MQRLRNLLIPACIIFAASALRAETVNVRDLGAVGDGKADDTAALQQAIDSKAAEVFFPAGTYRVTKTLQFNPGGPAQGLARVETLETSGRWFREQFPVTPVTAVTALEDYRQAGRKSVWYQSRFYRVNLYWHGDRYRVRDIHRFDERYAERYLTAACPSAACTYDTLPVVEGFLWSAKDVISGLVPMRVESDGTATPMRGGEPAVAETGSTRLTVRWPVTGGGELVTDCAEDSISWMRPGPSWRLELRWADGCQPPFHAVEGTGILCGHNGFNYTIRCRHGRPELDLPGRVLRLSPVNGTIQIDWNG